MVIRKDGHALAGDAIWSHHDMAVLTGMIVDHDTHLLITHGDIDHCSCIGAHPYAKAVGSAATAARIASGSAAKNLRAEAAAWGLQFEGEPRIDMIVAADTRLTLGKWQVRTLEAAGHAGDGMAYLIEEESLFLVGDYLMASQHPMVWWSLHEARRTTERLLETIERYRVERIVPGHGPWLSRTEAVAVGQQDIVYLREVERIADDAQRKGYARREWELAVMAVPVPRPCAPDIEMLCPRLLNAQATLRDRALL
ncbi:MAG: MBL fold metallo-hydrolase [Alphaproteobacteria bacterium]|nr:MBL fold metallo-hydrolase [Alphaproteobacteria bacterium]